MDRTLWEDLVRKMMAGQFGQAVFIEDPKNLQPIIAKSERQTIGPAIGDVRCSLCLSVKSTSGLSDEFRS
jgi:hypothetical protein